MTATQTGPWADQQHLTADEIKANVLALGPLFAEEADAVNERGHLTDRVKQALTDSGLWRMTFPAEWGGPQMRIDDQIELVEFVARHDASTAWNVMILVDGGVYASRLASPEIAHEIYPTMDLGTSATAFPVGRAIKVKDGYRLSGKWQFGSGVRDADRSVCGFHRYDNGADGDPVLGDDGHPEMFEVWVPHDQLDLHDTWYTTGLAGTGSVSFSVDGVVVPETHMVARVSKPSPQFPPLARYPILLAANQLGVPLGLARHALDEFRLFIEKARDTGTHAAKLEPTVLTALGEAEARYRAARAFALDTFGSATDALFEDRPLTAEQQGSMAAAMVLVSNLSRDAVELCCDAAGSRAVLASNPFDRIYRDMSTAIRHLLFRKKTYEMAGRRYLQADEVGIGRLS